MMYRFIVVDLEVVSQMNLKTLFPSGWRMWEGEKGFVFYVFSSLPLCFYIFTAVYGFSILNIANVIAMQYIDAIIPGINAMYGLATLAPGVNPNANSTPAATWQYQQ